MTLAVDDAELVLRAGAGDVQAREQLFGRHYLPVLRYFQLNATWVADDLTQRTFVACLERLSAVPADAFRPYLFGIARNQLLMHLRRARTRGALDPAEPAAQRTGVSTIVARSQRQRRLLVALGRLSEEERTALTLHYWDGLNATEVGQVLEVPSSTVRTRLARLRDRLRDDLVAQGEQGAEVEAELRAVGPRLER